MFTTRREGSTLFPAPRVCIHSRCTTSLLRSTDMSCRTTLRTTTPWLITVAGSATEDSAAPTHSRTSDWLTRSAIPTLVPTSVVTGCKLCVSEPGCSALGPSGFVPRIHRVFLECPSGGSNTYYTTHLFHSDCVRDDTYRKVFSSSNPPQCFYSIIQYPRTDFPQLAHSTITIAHIDCTSQNAPTAPPHYSTCLLLSGPPFFILLVDTLYRVSSSVVQIICLHLHHPSRSRPLCFIVNHKAICLLSVVILIYSPLLALDNKKLHVCILLTNSLRPCLLGQFDYRTQVNARLEGLRDSKMAHVVHIIVIHEVMRSWSDESGVCLMCFIGSEG